MEIKPGQNILVFVSMSRDTLIQSVALDGGWAVLTSDTTLKADIPKLLRRRPQRTLQFILHSAFCGSTLLARYLEALPHCLVLKEPQVLSQLAKLKGRELATGQPDWWPDWFEVVLAMLARGYDSDSAVVVKASSTCNSLGNKLLDHDERTRIVFLYSCLKTFLLQVLKSEDRRRWLRKHMDDLARSMARVPFLAGIRAEDMTDAQRASAMWLVNSFHCQSLLRRPDSHRVLLLDGESLMSRPNETVLAAADFLGLVNDNASRAVLVDLPALSRHAKDSSLQYDAIARAAELAEARERCRGEVAAAIEWADEVAADWLCHSPIPVE
jgi:hypothetical protein